MKNLVLMTLSAVLLSACETLSYYGQAVGGQLYILTHRRQIESMLAEGGIDPVVESQLELILEIRAFAEAELGLPLDGAFSTYVDVERPYVVWNVFAAPPYSLDPMRWCYPVAGCVSYRGYFREQAAQRFARDLKQQGYDTFVGGVAAYSTLGWFEDPVLSTVLNREDYELATLIFHELAHRVVYIPGDTQFNESFATAVEQEGLKRWLAAFDSEAGADREILHRVDIAEQRREQFVSLVEEAIAELEVIYQSGESETVMGERKAAVFDMLRTRYQSLREHWGGYDGYDNWFAGDLNNARLATVSTYFSLVPAFQALLREEGNRLEVFYRRAAELEEMEPEQRLELLTRGL